MAMDTKVSLHLNSLCVTRFRETNLTAQSVSLSEI